MDFQVAFGQLIRHGVLGVDIAHDVLDTGVILKSIA
jgi:hypothetical protein